MLTITTFLSKLLSTYLTHEQFFSSMSSDMLIEGTQINKCFSTYATAIWLPTSMNSYMLCEVIYSSKFFSTYVTDKGPLSIMKLFVSGEGIYASKSLSTYVTYMWRSFNTSLFFFADIFYMMVSFRAYFKPTRILMLKDGIFGKATFAVLTSWCITCKGQLLSNRSCISKS